MRKIISTLCVIALLIIAIGSLILAAEHANKVILGSSEWQARKKAISEGQTLVKMVDKIIAGETPSVEECREGFETVRSLRNNLNDAELGRRTSTSEVLTGIGGTRDWIAISTTIGAENSGMNKVGWLTTANSILKIGMARARWACFTQLLDKYGSLTKMPTRELCDTEIALISVREFLDEVDHESGPLSLKQIRGTCRILTGKEDMIGFEIPGRSHIHGSLIRVKELLEERSRQAQIAAGQ